MAHIRFARTWRPLPRGVLAPHRSLCTAGRGTAPPCSRASLTGRTPSVLAALEGRLPVAPLLPNEALRALVHMVPADAHHTGVVTHLVHTLSGNACCLDPTLCLTTMERLLSPESPSWLHGERGDPVAHSACTASAAEGTVPEVSVLLALAPLGRVLCRCVAARLRLCVGAATRSSNHGVGHWWLPAPLHVADTEIAADAQHDFLLRGAAVLLAFTAEPQYCPDDASSDSTSNRDCGHRTLGTCVEGGAQWRRAAASGVAVPVLMCLCAPGPLQHPPPQASLPQLGQRCWWWATLLCRAVPSVPSPAVRGEAAWSLVRALHELRDGLKRTAAARGSPAALSEADVCSCVELTEWLVVHSVPLIRDGAGERARCLGENSAPARAGVSPCSTWTTELRHALAGLADCLAALLATPAKPGEEHRSPRAAAAAVAPWLAYTPSRRRQLLRAVVSVVYRLTVQWVAAATPLATARAVTALWRSGAFTPGGSENAAPPVGCRGELAVVVRLLRPLLLSEGPAARDAVAADDDAEGLFADEQTWCRLASVVDVLRCTQRGASAALNTAPGPLDDGQLFFQQLEQRLLRAGVLHALRSKQTPATASSGVSAAFVLALIKSWRRWPITWAASRHVQWLESVAVLATPYTSRDLLADQEDEGAEATSSSHCGDCTATTDAGDDASFLRAAASQRRLTSLLLEVWHDSIGVEHDTDPLDVCASWYAFTAAEAVPQPRGMCTVADRRCSRAPAVGQAAAREAALCSWLDATALTGERRLGRHGASWLFRLYDIPYRTLLSAGGRRSESRPHPYREAEAWRAEYRQLSSGWCPMCLPALVSHLALRLLDHDRLTSPQHTHTRLLAVVRSAMQRPATEELAVFQLSLIVRFVEWCEAAGVSRRWCACAVTHPRGFGDAADAAATGPLHALRDLLRSASCRAALPWWVLTVDGLPVTGGVRGRVDAPLVVFLWEHTEIAATASATQMLASRSDDGAGDVAHPTGTFVSAGHLDGISRSTSAVQPLLPLRVVRSHRRSDAQEDGDDYKNNGEADSWSLARAVRDWSTRYALRLALLDVVEERWHRTQAAAAARQEPLVARRLHVRSLPPLPSRRSLDAAAGGAHVLYRTVTSGAGGAVDSVWNSDAYRPLLQWVTTSAAEVVEMLAAELRADMASHASGLSASFSTSLESGHTTPRHDRGSTDRIWSALRQRLSPAPVATPSSQFRGSFGDDRRWGEGAAVGGDETMAHVDTSIAAGAAAQVERLLHHPGLAPLVPSQEAPTPVLAGADAGECDALLASLLLSPAHLCTSPPALSFAADTLWCRCWAARHACHGVDAVAAAADLDKLVTWRAVLGCMARVHRLVEVWAEYLSSVYVPALVAASPGGAPHTAATAWLVATPVEAMRHQLQRIAATRSAHAVAGTADPVTAAPCHPVGFASPSAFTAEALRTYEVLVRCTLDGERRAPLVWQRWVQDVAATDPHLYLPRRIEGTLCGIP